ncbi:MAG TPA: outer membrane beta-barrel protein [Terriglobales bacterium]|jgi:hypothetical protein|nr:outer membrane beta-barrel protein [Terriglobales bacterium]
MRRLLFCVLALLLLSTAIPGFSQQTDVRQFVVFGAYTYLNTRSLNLIQRGFDGDLGYNYRSWLSFGFDFGYYDGHNTIYPKDLSPAGLALLAQLGPLPPGFGVPFNINTQTYEAGPQLNYRHLKKVTLFVRPALGALHTTAKVRQQFLAGLNQMQPGLATQFCAILLGCSKNDTVPFYGFGGGISWEITPHFGLRATGDFAHYNFFGSLLNGGRNSVRFSIGPKFSFGKNILEK